VRRIAIGLVVLLTIADARAGESKKKDSPAATLLYPNEAFGSLLPSGRISVWAITDLGDASRGNHLHVEFTRAEGVTFSPDKKLKDADARSEYWWHDGAQYFGARLEIPESSKRASIAIQAVDVNLLKPRGQKVATPLRLRIVIAAGKLRTEQLIEIPGDRFVGHHTFEKRRWDDRRIDLNTFYVADGETYTAYRLYLVRD
jgi:hypothetical protein